MAKQVLAGEEGRAVRQKERRNEGEKGMVIGGKTQIHNKHKLGQDRATLHKYLVTNILLKTE